MSERVLTTNPCCGYQVDWMEPFENLCQGKEPVCGQPSDGDIGVCLNCGAILCYDQEARPHIATPAQVARMPLHIFSGMMAARFYIKQRGPFKK